MWTIAKWSLARFWKLKLWIPALLLPAALFLLFLWRSGGSTSSSFVFLLGLLLYFLPGLAILFTLTTVDRSQWGMLRSTPLGFLRLLSGYWLGGTLTFLASIFLLVALGFAVGFLELDDSPGKEAIEYHAPTELSPGLGMPRDIRGDWISAGCPHTFEFQEIGGERDPAAFLSVAVGRVYIELCGNDIVSRRIRRESSVDLELQFPGDSPDAPQLAAPVLVKLRKREPQPVRIPVSAVREDGRLLVTVAKVATEDDPEPELGVLARHEDHAGHDHGHGTDRETREVRGPQIVWLEDRRNHNGVNHSGLLVVSRKIGFLGNFGRASLLAAGLIPLLVGMSTFAAALFRRAVAFAFCLTLYLCGVTMTFLREIVESLGWQSSASIFGVFRRPTFFDTALKALLDFWLTVLPDFEVFRASTQLSSGEAVQWATVGFAHALALVYVGAFLVLTLAGLRRWELTQ